MCRGREGKEDRSGVGWTETGLSAVEAGLLVGVYPKHRSHIKDADDERK